MLHNGNHLVIGIVGGMGPQAGVALLGSIIGQTPALSDQAHLSTMLMSFPGTIPDRTDFLQNETDVNPGYRIAEVIRKLELAGAGVVGIACNTSHSPRIFSVIIAELDRLQSQVSLLHMPEETCRYIAEHCLPARRVSVLATNGTYYDGLYRQLLEGMGLEVVMPEERFQLEVIHPMIYDPYFGLKAHSNPITAEAVQSWDRTLSYLTEHGVDTVILGCTELSLLPYQACEHRLRIIDSTAVMAKALISAATSGIKSQLHARTYTGY